MCRRAILFAFSLGTVAHAGQTAASDELIPAGVINSIFGQDNVVVIYEEDPAIEQYATAIRNRFFKDAQLMNASGAADADLSNNTLVVYGTPTGNAWIKKYADRLPVQYKKSNVRVQDRKFSGKDLRVICTICNPQNPKRRAVLYTAQRPEDVVNINDVFHGPTEWLVARGNKTLDAGNYQITKQLAPDAMAADLDYLVAKITNNHVSAREGLPLPVADAVADARRAIGKPLPHREFWLVVCRVLRSLDDAHSCMGGFPDGKTIDLPVNWLAEGLVVTDDTDQLKRGDRIIAVGELDEAQLLAVLRPLIPAETDAWVRCMGQHVLRNATVLNMIGVADQPPVPVTVERNGERKTLQIPAGGTHRSRNPQPPVRWTVEPEHDLAIFTLDTCRMDDNYKKAVRDFFIAVHDKHVSRIAIDVRHNGGGNSAVINEFLRYYDIDDYKDFSSEARWSTDAITKRREIRLPGFVSYGPQTRRNDKVADVPLFRGKTYVLTSKNTFSSANWFAVVFQDNKLGEIVGEPTGNAPSSFGDTLSFVLPESGITFNVSFKKWVRPDTSRDPADCVTPDRVIPLTREHIVTGEDPVLNALRADAKK